MSAGRSMRTTMGGQRITANRGPRARESVNVEAHKKALRLLAETAVTSGKRIDPSVVAKAVGCSENFAHQWLVNYASAFLKSSGKAGADPRKYIKRK